MLKHLSETVMVVIYDSWIYNYIVSKQPMPITTSVVSSNPAQMRCTQYNIM